VVSAAGSVCLALVFGRLAGFRPASGGPYAYTRQAYALFAIGGAGPDVVFSGFLLRMAGLPVYAWIAR
jgi:amino acid transporter